MAHRVVKIIRSNSVLFPAPNDTLISENLTYLLTL